MTQSFIVNIAISLLNEHTFGQIMDRNRTSKSLVSLQMMFGKVVRLDITYPPSSLFVACL